MQLTIWLVISISLFFQDLYNKPFSFEKVLSNEDGSHCFYSYRDTLATHVELDVQIQSENIVLVGKLFLPDTTGSHPIAVLMHGGGGNTERLRDTPFYFAPRLAHCGIAALAYDKRGTGDSGGDYRASTMDDFVTDAGNIANFLAEQRGIDADRIGIVGFSQGGRLAPVVAVRYPQISYAVSVSGPLTSVADTRLFALENSIKEAGASESVLKQVMPLWKSHFDAIKARDQEALSKLDLELEKHAGNYHSSLLPPFKDNLPRTGIYNSIGRDYVMELDQLSIPWFSVYGAEDIVIPVEESVGILHERMEAADHNAYEVKIIPDASHSFLNVETRKFIRFESMVVDWILEKI